CHSAGKLLSPSNRSLRFFLTCQFIQQFFNHSQKDDIHGSAALRERIGPDGKLHSAEIQNQISWVRPDPWLRLQKSA
ncbi:MAG TPA: hypothetical protein VLA51_12855, partial [Paracoccaceae bacterium]|nr:hypothetical protein [Paracoccaceae bacterium]